MCDRIIHVSFATAFVASIAFYLFATMAAACTPAVKAREAEAGYLAQQLDCVDKYSTKADIDRCRLRVKAAWAADGGDDGQ